MGDLSYTQAIAQLQSLGQATPAQLRALVAQIRVTQADLSNLSLDRSGPVSATLLYSGTIAKDYGDRCIIPEITHSAKNAVAPA